MIGSGKKKSSRKAGDTKTKKMGGSKAKSPFAGRIKGETECLIKIGQSSARNAIRASKALGLPITYMERGVLYRETPDGQKEVITDSSENTKSVVTPKKIKKGMVLYAKN